jgi:hypothetical protein
MRNYGRVILCSVLVLLLSSLAGCGGGGDAKADDSATPEVFIGQVRAVTVADLDYTSTGPQGSAARQGRTSSSGDYEYTKDSTIGFGIRRWKFGGEVPSSAMISLLHLSNSTPAAVLIARLLATVDADKNLANGITFTEPVLQFFDRAPAIDLAAADAETKLAQLLADLSRDTNTTYELWSPETLFAALTAAERCASAGIFVGKLSANGTMPDPARPGQTLSISKAADIAVAIQSPQGTVAGYYVGEVRLSSNNSLVRKWQGWFDIAQPLAIDAPTHFTAETPEGRFSGILASVDMIDLKLDASSAAGSFTEAVSGTVRLTRRYPAKHVHQRFVTRSYFDPDKFMLVEVSDSNTLSWLGWYTQKVWPETLWTKLPADGNFDMANFAGIERLRFTGKYDEAKIQITGFLPRDLAAPFLDTSASGPWQGCTLP